MDRFDRAERAAQFLRALANRLLRDFPADPFGHFLMSEFYMQESKKAWRRNDIASVRTSLTASISSLGRALELDPANDSFRSQIIDHTNRRDALPPP